MPIDFLNHMPRPGRGANPVDQRESLRRTGRPELSGRNRDSRMGGSITPDTPAAPNEPIQSLPLPSNTWSNGEWNHDPKWAAWHENEQARNAQKATAHADWTAKYGDSSPSSPATVGSARSDTWWKKGWSDETPKMFQNEYTKFRERRDGESQPDWLRRTAELDQMYNAFNSLGSWQEKERWLMTNWEQYLRNNNLYRPDESLTNRPGPDDSPTAQVRGRFEELMGRGQAPSPPAAPADTIRRQPGRINRGG